MDETLGPSSLGGTAAAFELVSATGPVPLVITCEHASNALPAPWTWPASDTWIASTHWAWDPGAAAMTRGLAGQLGASAVLARFSRLLIDANRPLDSETLFRDVADSGPVAFNRDLSPEDIERRIEGYWRPYHAAIDAVTDRVCPRLLVAVHSFTPVYEGDPRAVQVGVLHVDQPQLAAWFRDRFVEQTPYDVQINKPYSGEGGCMFSPHSHAVRAGCPTIELEFRNDLLQESSSFDRLLAATVSIIRRALDEEV